LSFYNKVINTETGKGENIWDVFSERQGTIADGSTGKIACNSYEKYKEDVQLLKNLGVSDIDCCFMSASYDKTDIDIVDI